MAIPSGELTKVWKILSSCFRYEAWPLLIGAMGGRLALVLGASQGMDIGNDCGKGLSHLQHGFTVAV